MVVTAAFVEAVRTHTQQIVMLSVGSVCGELLCRRFSSCGAKGFCGGICVGSSTCQNGAFGRSLFV